MCSCPKRCDLGKHNARADERPRLPSTKSTTSITRGNSRSSTCRSNAGAGFDELCCSTGAPHGVSGCACSCTCRDAE